MGQYVCHGGFMCVNLQSVGERVWKIKQVVDKALERLLIAIISCMFVLVLLQVFTRFVLDAPLSWTEELARYLMVWMGFLGAGIGLKYGLHMSLGILSDRLKGKPKLVMHVLSHVLTLGIGVLICVYGYKIMLSGRERLSMALQFKMQYVFIVIPISGVIIILNCLESIDNALKHARSIRQDKGQESGIKIPKE